MARIPQELRPYQSDAINAVLMGWRKGVKAPLLNMATGAGKTTIISQLVRITTNPKFQRAMVIAHTEEITLQIWERLGNQFAELDYFYPVNGRLVPGLGVVMGSKYNDVDARIISATRQSLNKKRLDQILEHGAPDLLIIDEAHHIAAGNTYLDIADRLREANPALRVAGVTATAERSDNKALAVLFDEIVYTWTITDGIVGGYLVPATRKRIMTGIDLSGVPTLGGDYNQDQLASVLEASNWLDLGLDAFDQLYRNQRQTLAFWPSVEMSRAFTTACIERGIAAAHIDGTTPKDLRREILRDYKAGKLVVVSNHNVLTEGFDAPQTSGILDARPTKSSVVKTQMWGRGLRIYPDKLDCLILDLSPHDTRVSEMGSLLGRLRTCTKCKAEFFYGFKACPQCHEPITVAEKDEESAEDAALFGGWSSKKEIMIGLHEEIVPIIGSLNAAWWTGPDEYLSVSLGFKKGALVIAPPTWKDITRIRERIMRGMSMLGEYADDQENSDWLTDQIDRLRREMDRADKYQLYFVSQEGVVEYIRANEDLAALMIQADNEVMRHGASKREVDKFASWRYQLPRDAKAPNWLKKLLHQYRVAIPNMTGWTQGQVNERLTYYLHVPSVMAYIKADRLPEPEENAA